MEEIRLLRFIDGRNKSATFAVVHLFRVEMCRGWRDDLTVRRSQDFPQYSAMLAGFPHCSAMVARSYQRVRCSQALSNAVLWSQAFSNNVHKFFPSHAMLAFSHRPSKIHGVYNNHILNATVFLDNQIVCKESAFHNLHT